ncbi:putative L,D-transpeptidase YcbB [Altererythrobacter insulae]|nr:putative L,D-transpeptidase YcbB [Altererythrobacter insulae]
MANVAKRLINIDRKLFGVATVALLPLLAWSTPLSAETTRIAPSMPVAVKHSGDGMYYVDPELRPFPTSPSSNDARQNFLVEKFDEAIAKSVTNSSLQTLLQRNRERAAMLPQDLPERFIIVDAASQMLTVYQGGQPLKQMRVVVGKRSNPTPMLAGYIRYAEIDPYWNIPADLTREMVAPLALREGPQALEWVGYEVLKPTSEADEIIDPRDVDWRAIQSGETNVRVRQKPGGSNAMGRIKFMLPNRLGIYLHDTPKTELLNYENRLFSAGCVRLEDADGLASLLFGEGLPDQASQTPQRITLEEPVPVFITYFTAWPTDDGIEQRRDVYGRDRI